MKLEGGERLVLKFLLDLQGDTTVYVEDARLAAAAKMLVGDVRDWLETLEGKGCVERARGTEGFSAYVTAKGKQALRLAEPIPSPTPSVANAGSGSPSLAAPSSTVGVKPHAEHSSLNDSDDFDVFLAHNSKDKPSVIRLGEELKKQGLKPWLDIEQIPPGRWFQDVIQAVIPSVRSVVIVIGPSGIGRWQVLELRAFISQCVERDIPVIPVLLPGIQEIPPSLLFLKELNCVRCGTSVEDPKCIAALVWGITGRKPG
jgi:DNA-binding MarR family transcriptional regulator